MNNVDTKAAGEGTLDAFFLRHGIAGLRRLAEKSGTKTSYLLQLRYVPHKRPSLEMAEKLIAAGDGELTMSGLANPTKTLVRDARAARQ